MIEKQKSNSVFTILTENFYIWYFCIIFCLLLISFWKRAAYFDDAWFAEQSYWLDKAGYVRSSMFSEFNKWNEHVYICHKLYIYLGAAVMHVAEFSVMGCKLLNMIGGGFTVYLMWNYFKPYSREQQWLAVILLIGCGSFINFVSINRPEIICMLFGFSSYYCLHRPKTNKAWLILSSIFAGSAALTHLNGLIYLAAGAIWLATFRQYRQAVLFSITGGLTLCLYAVDALLDGNLALFYTQFVGDPATQNNFSLYQKLSLMVRYHEIFFHSHKEFPLVVITLISILLNKRHQLFSDPTIRYTGLLLTTFLVLTKSNTDIYFLLFVPWFVTIATVYLTSGQIERFLWKKKLIRGLLISYGVVALFCVSAAIIENRKLPYAQDYNILLARQMPEKHAKIIAPLSFFFGQMTDYSIQSLTYYSFPILHKNLSLDEFFRQAEESEAKYIVSDGYKYASYEIPLNAPEIMGNYRRIYRDELTSIYARQK